MFKLISDTSCDWVKDYADEHDVTLVPLYTTFDGQTYYKEQFEISYDEFYRKMTDENAFLFLLYRIMLMHLCHQLKLVCLLYAAVYQHFSQVHITQHVLQEI